jgi:hypothetical protein
MRDTLARAAPGPARIYGTAPPGRFVLGGRKPVTINLFKWLRTSADGAPVFAPPVRIEAPFNARAFVFRFPAILNDCLAIGRLAHTNGRMPCDNGRLAHTNGRLAHTSGRLAHTSGQMPCDNGQMP